MKLKILLLFIVVINTLSAQRISDKTLRLTEHWQFVQQDLGGIWEAIRPVKVGHPESVPLWSDVQIPHCFNARDAVDPDVNYYQGPGWYKSSLHVKNPYSNGHTLLYFEGAGQKSDVYIGADKVGHHVGGYDEWMVDISEAVSSYDSSVDGSIPLSIRCDNSRDLEMIPSDLSDFNVYGGLYRYLNMLYVPQHYIKQVHASSTFKGTKGKVDVRILFNEKPQGNMSMKLLLTDDKGVSVYETSLLCVDSLIEHQFDLKNIVHWSPDSPSLYHLDITTSLGQHYSDNIAFRTFEFKEKGPFFLNGERLLLQGTHRHEDHAGVAAAMTEDMIRQEMVMMKEMGVNFIRLGHYQQSRIVLNLCDSLGILVWEEIPWCRGGLGGEVYKAQAKRMLTHMIEQHYNHPSIIIWGLGNENDWPGDYAEFDKEKIRAFMQELHVLAHELDTERKTGIRRCDFCKDVVDVYSPSIWAGWYRGKFMDYKRVSHTNMEDVNHFFHMEWGGSSHAGRHDENPDKGLEFVQGGGSADERDGDAALVGGSARVSKDGNWSETYICNLFDWHLKEQLTMPWLSGAAQWAFKDFSTPVRPENPVPYMNQKGVVERDLTPKEGYYVFQSYWTSKPMVHIYGHSWPVRWGKENAERLVKVYSNCERVELFLNGQSLGVKDRNTAVFPACGLFWNVPFTAGDNELVAKAYNNKKEASIDTLALKYQTEIWGETVALSLSEEIIDEQYSWVKVEALDANGILCLDAKNRVCFSLVGDATLLENLGTATGASKVELCNGTAKIKVKRSGHTYAVSVSSVDLPTALYCAH